MGACPPTQGCADTKPFAQAETGARRLSLRLDDSVFSTGTSPKLPHPGVTATFTERGGPVQTGELTIERVGSIGPLHRPTLWGRVRVSLGGVEGEADLDDCNGDPEMDLGV